MPKVALLKRLPLSAPRVAKSEPFDLSTATTRRLWGHVRRMARAEGHRAAPTKETRRSEMSKKARAFYGHLPLSRSFTSNACQSTWAKPRKRHFSWFLHNYIYICVCVCVFNFVV